MITSFPPFFQEVSNQGVEIIFVSSDRSAADMASYMKESHGDWPALEHGSDACAQLKQKFAISGIPSLVVLRAATGELVTKDGRADVQGKGPQVLRQWKGMA